MLDVVLEGGELIDGTGPPRAAPTWGSPATASPPSATSGARHGREPWSAPARSSPPASSTSTRTPTCPASSIPRGGARCSRASPRRSWGTAATRSARSGPRAERRCSTVCWAGASARAAADLVDWSWRSLPEFMDALARRGTGTNKAFLVGRGRCGRRSWARGSEPATPDEIGRMRALLGTASRRGRSACRPGSSTARAAHAATDEIVALARELGRSTRSTSPTCGTRATGWRDGRRRAPRDRPAQQASGSMSPITTWSAGGTAADSWRPWPTSTRRGTRGST